MTVHQYMKSTDPQIIAAVTAKQEAYQGWSVRLHDWAEKILGRDPETLIVHGRRDSYVYFQGFRDEDVAGVELPGRWTKDPIKPYKTNPLYREFEEIGEYRAPSVPGRPNLLSSDDRGDGTRWSGSGVVFVLDGVAYSGLGFTPSFSKGGGEGWEEIRGSEYLAAQERYNEGKQQPHGTAGVR